MNGTGPSPSIEEGDTTFELAGDMRGGMLAAFVDGFFDPQGGFHVGGAVGFAGFGVDENEDGDPLTIDHTDSFTGLELAAWVGYGGWVGKQRQLGGMLGVSAFMLANESDTATATGQTFSVLFTAIDH